MACFYIPIPPPEEHLRRGWWRKPSKEWIEELSDWVQIQAPGSALTGRQVVVEGRECVEIEVEFPPERFDITIAFRWNGQ